MSSRHFSDSRYFLRKLQICRESWSPAAIGQRWRFPWNGGWPSFFGEQQGRGIPKKFFETCRFRNYTILICPDHMFGLNQIVGNMWIGIVYLTEMTDWTCKHIYKGFTSGERSETLHTHAWCSHGPSIDQKATYWVYKNQRHFCMMGFCSIQDGYFISHHQHWSFSTLNF